MKWVVVDHAHSGMASGIAVKRLYREMDKAGIAYEAKLSCPDPLGEHIIIVAENTDATARNLLGEIVTEPESIQMASIGNIRILSGSDERGFAYSVMEMAERIEAYGEEALIKLHDEVKSPSVRVRGIDRQISNTGDCEWWMSEEYWRYYLERMLAARYNRLVFLVGFDTSYMAPPYPFFVDVPEFPNVKLIGKVNREDHAKALHMLGCLAHEYGMEFVFATWEQALWLKGQVSMVEGITDLAAYNSAGIRELALQFPEIDVIHLRVNHEAGVGTQITAEEYWFRQMDGLAEARARGSKATLEMRAKGLTDPMIEYAKNLGLDLTVSTKYWCEQAGLPHHLTRMRTEELERLDNLNHSRRYSYADMLKKPRLHKFLYRIWNDGSTNLFTWGDPDYVRRFVASMALGKADGYETMPPLSMKGGPEDFKYIGWKLFDDPVYQPEGYEDSRYWLFNRLFGRIGYDVNERDDAWMRIMRMKYGEGADSLMQAVEAGSKLIPFIIGYHMPVHPQLAYWAEFSTGGALFSEHNYNSMMNRVGVTYQTTEPGDCGLFYPIADYVKDSLAGKEDGRYTPWQVSEWLERISANILKYMAEAEVAGIAETPESRGVLLDLKMLREFALYHRNKLAAALTLCMYKETSEAGYVAKSLGMMEKARANWASFAELGKKYHSHLSFGVGSGGTSREGSWCDFFPELDADIETLKAMVNGAAAACMEFSPASVAPLCWTDDVPCSCKAGEALAVSVTTGPQDVMRDGVTLRYRHTNQKEGLFLSMPMKYRDGKWRAEIPAEYIVYEWDLLVYFEAVAPNGDGMIFPGVWHPKEPLPYHIVEVR